jgi:hypothetical protein
MRIVTRPVFKVVHTHTHTRMASKNFQSEFGLSGKNDDFLQKSESVLSDSVFDALSNGAILIALRRRRKMFRAKHKKILFGLFLFFKTAISISTTVESDKVVLVRFFAILASKLVILFLCSVKKLF